jgi:hypothetical protein
MRRRAISLAAAALMMQSICTVVDAESLNGSIISSQQALTTLFTSAGVNLPADEVQEICDFYEASGVDDLASFINPQMLLTTVPQSRVKDLNGDGILNSSDASYILQFLQGQQNYQYSYSDMDANGDDVVDKADSYEYMDYYMYMLVHGYNSSNVPFSGHNAGSAPSVASAERSYIKHNYSDGANTSSNDVFYYLGNSNSLTSMPADYLAEQAVSLLNEINEPESVNSAPNPNYFTKVQDSRVVRCATGSGAIVGPHLILTSASNVFDINTHKYKVGANCDISVFTFDSNNEPIRTDVVVESFHVPATFVSALPEDYDPIYDYALIVVEDDLTDYGMFSLGVPLDAAIVDHLPVTAEGFPRCAPCFSSGFRKYTVASNGFIGLNLSTDPDMETYFIVSAASYKGSEGSPVFLQSIYGSSTYEPIVTIFVDCDNNSFDDGGVRVIRPILRFVYDNPFL